MAVLVRMASASDADAVRRVVDAAFAAHRSIYRPGEQAIQKLADQTPALDRLVAEEAGRIVGTVRFGLDSDLLRVIGLAVDPAHHRRGVGKALIESLASIARDRGCRALSLYTIVQTGNVPVFERLGFEVVDEQPDDLFVSVRGEQLTEARMERAT